MPVRDASAQTMVDDYMTGFEDRTWRSQSGGWQGAGQVGVGPGFQQQLLAMQNQQMATRMGGLPRGGLEQQLDSINQYYDQVRNATIQLPKMGLGMFGAGGGKMRTYHIGFDPQAYEAGLLGGVGQEQDVGEMRTGYTQDLNSLARRLAKSYGLDIGRGELVDQSGNLLITPDQIQAASGGSETIGSAAAKLNYLSAAITREQNLQQQQKGIAAIQTGLGLVQKRGRGSLAAMQSGMYQDLADLYSNQQFEAADYSYFIMKERMDLAAELDRRAREISKKRARSQFWGGIAMGVLGAFGGDWGAAARGVGMATSAYADTGYDDRWF